MCFDLGQSDPTLLCPIGQQDPMVLAPCFGLGLTARPNSVGSHSQARPNRF